MRLYSGRPNQMPKEREAVFSIIDGELKPVVQRTNSLGVSKTQCHNCRANARSCDRQRPKCGSCLKTNQGCGYTLDVRWKPPRVAGKPPTIPHSERPESVIPLSVSPYGDKPPAVPQALYYHQHCFADIAVATPGCRLNPLRSVMPLVVGSVPLQHAMVLLAATHRQNPRIELMRLKSKALKSFAGTLPHLDDTTKMAVILVLLFADFVHSGQSAWLTHLSAVAKILESKHCGKNQRLLMQEESYRAIVFQFYWFDIMNALLLARSPVLPVKILDDAIRINREQAKSKLDSMLFDAFGLTEQMFSVLSRIVRGDDCSTEGIQALKIPDAGCFIRNGWTVRDAEERVHMEEVWKHATATYLMTRNPPYRWPRHVFELHAQKVFEHAACLGPPSTMGRRSLFPLLFAGSCTPYSERRDFMRRYCVECFRDTKFGVFQMGLEILQRAWMLRSQEEEERKAVGGQAFSCWRNVTTGTDGVLINELWKQVQQQPFKMK